MAFEGATNISLRFKDLTLTWILLVLLLQCRLSLPYVTSITNRGRLHRHVFGKLHGVTMAYCLDNCLLRSMCRSVNYDIRQMLCEMNDAVGEQNEYDIPNNYVFHIMTETIPTTEFEGCADKPCPRNMKCLSGGTGEYECIQSECDEIPIVINSIKSTTERKIGTIISYECETGYFTPRAIRAICGHDGIWTRPNSECRKAGNCAELRDCNPEYEDGEYWLFPAILNGTKFKVYCYGMLSDPLEYISLSRSNYAVLSSSVSSGIGCDVILGAEGDTESHFDKIRVIPSSMSVVTDDFTFATTKLVPQPWNGQYASYGKGGDCASNNQACLNIGTFQIDTTGTGLFVDPSLEWVASGWQPVISDFYRSEDGYVIRALCGGNCGFCLPKTKIILHLKTGDEPDLEEATMPHCV